MFQFLGMVPSSECSYFKSTCGTERPLSVTSFCENTHWGILLFKGPRAANCGVKGQRARGFISREVYLFGLSH